MRVQVWRASLDFRQKRQFLGPISVLRSVLLFRDLALFVECPVDLSSFELPFVPKCGFELCLGQTRRQSPYDHLQPRRWRFGSHDSAWSICCMTLMRGSRCNWEYTVRAGICWRLCNRETRGARRSHGHCWQMLAAGDCGRSCRVQGRTNTN